MYKCVLFDKDCPTFAHPSSVQNNHHDTHARDNPRRETAVGVFNQFPDLALQSILGHGRLVGLLIAFTYPEQLRYAGAELKEVQLAQVDVDRYRFGPLDAPFRLVDVQYRLKTRSVLGNVSEKDRSDHHILVAPNRNSDWCPSHTLASHLSKKYSSVAAL